MPKIMQNVHFVLTLIGLHQFYFGSLWEGSILPALNSDMKRQILLLLLMFTAATSFAQEMKIIRLKKSAKTYHATHFYIANIVDDRADTSAIGTMRAGMLNRTLAINLQGGVKSAFEQYAVSPAESDAAIAPVTLSIKQLTIAEKGGAMRERVTIEYTYAFYSKDIKLISYSGSAFMETSMDASVYIEKLIRESVDNTIAQADGQYKQISGILRPATLEVKVAIGDATAGRKLIYYNRQRPLKISDFTDKADDLSLASAATYCGLGINLSYETINGKMIATITLSVYADPSKSWMRNQSKNPDVLSHEQNHFDIAAIIACKLKGQIMQQKFTPENLQSEVMKLYNEASELLNKEQDQYDTETVHGQIKAMQAKWKSKIGNQLNAQGCFQ